MAFFPDYAYCLEIKILQRAMGLGIDNHHSKKREKSDFDESKIKKLHGYVCDRCGVNCSENPELLDILQCGSERIPRISVMCVRCLCEKKDTIFWDCKKMDELLRLYKKQKLFSLRFSDERDN